MRLKRGLFGVVVLTVFLISLSFVSANSVNITYPLNNTNYVQSISNLNYTISGSDLHSCWYSNNSGAWNSSTVSAGTNFSISALEGENIWNVYCSELYNGEGFPTTPDTESSGVALYSTNFTINGQLAQPGDKVAAYDPDGVVCGVFTVHTAGYYGFMPVYRGDGIVITFTVLDNSTNLVYNVTRNYTVSGAALQFPSVQFDFGDVNCTDCIVNSSMVTFNQDTIFPAPTIVYPLNQTYSINVSELNYTFTETNPSKCWYSNFSGVWNSSAVDCGTNFTDVISLEGSNIWTLYMNDTFGNLNSINITFFKDTIYPLISFGDGTEDTATNFSRNWIYINTSWTETNLVNITFFLYNDTGIVNSTTYTTAVYSINLTNLIDNNYSYEVNITDVANNKNSTGIRTITIDDTSPNVNIDFPLDGASYNHNNISINYTVSDNLIGLSSCWYTNDSGANNYTITCNQNFTQNLSEGAYTYVLYANDSLNNVDSSSVTFGITTTAPAIVLNSPSNNQWFNNGNNIYFNFTATDEDGLDTCELWGNWTGEWHKNYTWINPTSAIMNFTILNITEGNYIWNVWCNDTSNNGNFATLNKTFSIDTTYPLISYDAGTSANAITLSQSNIYVNVTLTETNFANITFNLANDSGIIHSNVYTTATYEINWTSLSDGDYSCYVNITDNANNKNSTEIRTLTLDTTPPSLSIVYPENTTYSVNVSALNYTSSESGYCWYSIDDGTTNSSSVSARTNFTSVTSSEGSNTWKLYCNDSVGNLNSTSVTFFKDTIYPLFSNYLDNSGTLTTSGTAWFNATILNANGTVFLQINNQNYTTSNLTSNVYNVSVNLSSSGTYPYYWISWSNSTLNNYNISGARSYVVNSPASPPSSSSGGGGGGGSLSTGATIILNEEQFKAGYTKELAKNDMIKVNISGAYHSVKVNNLTSTGAIITVSSTPQQATLKIGEENKFDVTDDGYYDLSAKLNSINITSNKVSLTVKSIYEKVQDTVGITEDVVNNRQEEESQLSPEEIAGLNTNSRKLSVYYTAGIIIIILAVIVFFVFIRYRKKRHK